MAGDPKWLDYKEKVVTTFTQTEDFILCVWMFACMYVCTIYVLGTHGCHKKNQITWD